MMNGTFSCLWNEGAVPTARQSCQGRRFYQHLVPLAPGTYALHVRSDKGAAVSRFVVE